MFQEIARNLEEGKRMNGQRKALRKHNIGKYRAPSALLKTNRDISQNRSFGKKSRQKDTEIVNYGAVYYPSIRAYMIMPKTQNNKNVSAEQRKYQTLEISKISSTQSSIKAHRSANLINI